MAVLNDLIVQGSTRLVGDAIGTKFIVASGTITGNLIIGGSDIPQVADNLSKYASVHSIKFYRNGFLIPYQMDDANDGGFFRVRGTTESNAVCEIGTWDDSGAGETIQFNYYPTTSTINPTYSVSVPKATGTLALTSQLPTKTSQLTNDSGYLKSHQSVTLASGTNNGTLKITTAAGTTDNVAVKGINSMAYQATSSYSSATQVNTALAGKSGTGHTHDDRYTKVHYSKVNVTGNLTNVTCPQTLSTDGEQCNVLYVNNSTEHTVSVSTNYKSPDNKQINLTIKANGYAEVNYLYFGGTIYVRAV